MNWESLTGSSHDKAEANNHLGTCSKIIYYYPMEDRKLLVQQMYGSLMVSPSDHAHQHGFVVQYTSHNRLEVSFHLERTPMSNRRNSLQHSV